MKLCIDFMWIKTSTGGHMEQIYGADFNPFMY